MCESRRRAVSASDGSQNSSGARGHLGIWRKSINALYGTNGALCNYTDPRATDDIVVRGSDGRHRCAWLSAFDGVQTSSFSGIEQTFLWNINLRIKTLAALVKMIRGLNATASEATNRIIGNGRIPTDQTPLKSQIAMYIRKSIATFTERMTTVSPWSRGASRPPLAVGGNRPLAPRLSRAARVNRCERRQCR